ncbi:MAG: hypothetical protein RBU25_18875, partial [Lentisphaeria bacterium]|nr:hypothetical protein [Lentisphaeria bacterium]
VLDVWYVNTSHPVSITKGSLARRRYTISGHADCERVLKSETAFGPGVPYLLVEPGGVMDIPVSLTIASAADPTSFYTTTGYTIQVQHARSQTESVAETVATLGAGGGTVDFTVTVGEGDVGATLVVSAHEDLGVGAPPGVYFLGTNMVPMIVTRYDYLLQLMNAPPAGR